jgi:hypothetical protein
VLVKIPIPQSPCLCTLVAMAQFVFTNVLFTRFCMLVVAGLKGVTCIACEKQKGVINNNKSNFVFIKKCLNNKYINIIIQTPINFL